MNNGTPGASATGAVSHQTQFAAFCSNHFQTALVGVLALAALNAWCRLDREVLTEWDESLYATTAAEIATHGNWIATTFDGELDYYNSKPPLNVWLIALSFRAFGIALLPLRAPSATATCVTVLALVLWTRRAWGGCAAITAGFVLSTTFGFLYVHSGRSANTDALFTLFILWLLAATAALILFPISRKRIGQWLGDVEGHRYERALMAAWVAATMVIPTLMSTKVAWYLNPFFPIYALAVGAALARGLTFSGSNHRSRRRLLVAAIIVAFSVAESKLLWYSLLKRDLRNHAQGVLLEGKDRLAGRRVFKATWSRADRFVTTYVIGAEPREARNISEFIAAGFVGDFVLVEGDGLPTHQLSCTDVRPNHRLCEYVATR